MTLQAASTSKKFITYPGCRDVAGKALTISTAGITLNVNQPWWGLLGSNVAPSIQIHGLLSGAK